MTCPPELLNRNRAEPGELLLKNNREPGSETVVVEDLFHGFLIAELGPVGPTKREMYFSSIYRMGKSAKDHVGCLVRG